MFKITCSELTGESCNFVAEGETKGMAKEKFYGHGAGSPVHQKAYLSATDEQKAAFGKKVDEYLAKQE